MDWALLDIADFRFPPRSWNGTRVVGIYPSKEEARKAFDRAELRCANDPDQFWLSKGHFACDFDGGHMFEIVPVPRRRNGS